MLLSYSTNFKKLVGGLIVLGLFLKGLTTLKCLDKFVLLSKKAFRPRKIFSSIKLLKFMSHPNYLRKAVEVIISFLADSHYAADGLEEALQSTFGKHTSMQDSSPNHLCVTKVGVTATSADTTIPCIFTNYVSNLKREGVLFLSMFISNVTPFFF